MIVFLLTIAGISILLYLALGYVFLVILAGIVAFILIYLAFACLGINIIDLDRWTRELPRQPQFLVGSSDPPGEGSKTLHMGPRGWGRYERDGKFWPSR